MGNIFCVCTNTDSMRLIGLFIPAAIGTGLTVPSWLESADELYPDFSVALEKIHKIPPQATSRDILLSLDENPLGYSGSPFREDVAYEEVRDIVRTLLPYYPVCADHLDPWIYRPRWHVYYKQEVLKGRGCVENLLREISKVPSDNIDNVQRAKTLIKVLLAPIHQLYSGEAQYIVESEYGRPPKKMPDEIDGLCEYLRKTKPELWDMIVEHRDLGKITPRLRRPEDVRYWTRLIGSQFTSRDVFHFPAFLDHYRDFMDIWRVAIKDPSLKFDDTEVIQVMARQVVLDNPIIEYRPRIFSYPSGNIGTYRLGWTLTTSILYSIDNGSTIHKKCLPIDNAVFLDTLVSGLSLKGKSFEDFDPNDGEFAKEVFSALRDGENADDEIFFKFIECILNSIDYSSSNRLSESQIASILYLARIVTSSSRFF